MGCVHGMGPNEVFYYQSLIGVMEWMIKIGQIDTNTKVYLLSSHSAMSRQGHLEAALYIVGCLKIRHNSRLMFDPSYPNDYSNFWDCDWTNFYEGAVEAISPNAPQPWGKEVDLCMVIDSNLAGNKFTRRSRAMFMICMNVLFINWYSKKQSTI